MKISPSTKKTDSKKLRFGVLATALVVAVAISSVAFQRLSYKTQPKLNPLLGIARASAMRRSIPLVTAIGRAEVIVVGQINDYVADPQLPRKARSAFDPEASSAATLQPSGKYSIGVIQALKGQCAPTLQLNLPPLLWVYYDSAQLSAHKGDSVLLMLNKSPQGDWIPVDSTVPLIRLANGSEGPAVDKTSGAVYAQVMDLMLASLADPQVRSANIYLLRDVVNPAVAQAMKQYSNDPDLRIRDHALNCLALNQDVTVIPLIAQLETAVDRTNHGSANSVGALDNLRTPLAVPYLNPLLFQSAYFSRLNAADALRNLADQTSIPYLILALRDPDPQHIIPYQAYWTLHRLIPELGPPKDLPYFQVASATEVQPIYKWWQDELQGKHPHPLVTAPEVAKGIDATSPTAKETRLLFDSSVVNRRLAVTALQKIGTRDTVPYLILALQDPDLEISYDAYTILSRLIPNLKEVKDSAAYAINKKALNQPIYNWWEDELKGAHT